MPNDRIDMLLKMAAEAEGLDAARAGSAGPAPVTWWRVGLAAAAALAATVGYQTFLRPTPAPIVPPLGPSLTAMATPADEAALNEIIEAHQREMARLPDAPPDDASATGRAMLLAVFRDATDTCGCVVWEEWPVEGRPLAEVSRAELIDAAMNQKCAGASDLLLVMALQGEAADMPPSPAAAEALASCVTSGPERCAVDSASYATNAMSCLPSGVSVIAETLR